MDINMRFVVRSLELHLFLVRIMKEHSFFLQLGFTPRDATFTEQADWFRMEYDKLLRDVVALSDGIVSKESLKSGELITQYTLEAEKVTKFYTGVDIPIDITKAEAKLEPGRYNVAKRPLVEKVAKINNRAIQLTCKLIDFKAEVLEKVEACKMFTLNYPLLIEHILREARLYLDLTKMLQKGRFMYQQRDALEQEAFWNRIMAEHAKFIRGLLDPTEEELFNLAGKFGNQFEQLTKDAKAAMDRQCSADKVTRNSLRATEEIREFKGQATEGLVDCNIKSIILPLLGDHTLREANHFLRILRSIN